MIAEISAAIAAVQAVNGAINSLKESAGHAGDLSAVVGRWADATEKAQEAEKKAAGAMSYSESLALESVSRQLANFDRQLQDICIMQGQADLYTSIKRRMEESRLAHEKEVARIRRKRKQRREALQLAGIILLWGIFGIAVIMATVWTWAKFR